MLLYTFQGHNSKHKRYTNNIKSTESLLDKKCIKNSHIFMEAKAGKIHSSQQDISHILILYALKEILLSSLHDIIHTTQCLISPTFQFFDFYILSDVLFQTLSILVHFLKLWKLHAYSLKFTYISLRQSWNFSSIYQNRQVIHFIKHNFHLFQHFQTLNDFSGL
jgi:hypothetical protein